MYNERTTNEKNIFATRSCKSVDHIKKRVIGLTEKNMFIFLYHALRNATYPTRSNVDFRMHYGIHCRYGIPNFHELGNYLFSQSVNGQTNEQREKFMNEWKNKW